MLRNIKELYSDWKQDPNQFPKFKNTLKNNYVFSDTNGKLYLKLFIFNDKYTKDGWKGDTNEIPTNLKMNLGHPLTIAANSNFLFAHPGSKKLAYAVNEQIQKPFVIGENVALSEPTNNGDYFAIYDITNKDAYNFFKEIRDKDEIPLPFWSSPQIVHDSSENDNNIKRFKIQHNVLTDAPSFGKDAAVADSLCEGDVGQCMPVLTTRQSSLHDLIEEDNCSFCVVGRLTEIFKNNITTLQASLSNSSQSVDSSNNAIMSEQQNSNTTQTGTGQEQTLTTGQPIKPNNNNNNNLDTKSEITKTQFQLPPTLDAEGLKKLIDSAISERFAKQATEQPQKGEEPTTTKKEEETKQQQQQPNKTNYQDLDPEVRERLAKAEENEKEIKKLKDRVYKDDVGNLLLEYYKNNNAFKDEKAELDEKRYGKVLEYWTKKGLQVDEIKETIEVVSLMYNPNVTSSSNKKEAEITKKASTHLEQEDVTIYDVPKTQEPQSNNNSNKSEKPYWDRSIFRNEI